MRKMKFDNELVIYAIMILVILVFIWFLPEIDGAIKNFWHSLK